ncbi:hypothetical protein V2G26_002851 [Clonostachys chloroleuca]
MLRALVLFFVAAAINQLRWYYTQHSTTGRRIGFLQALDDASRANIEAAIVNGWGHYATLQFENDDSVMEKVFPTPLKCPEKSKASCSWKNINNLAIDYECATQLTRLLDLDKDYELNMTASMTRPEKSTLPQREYPLIIHVRATGRPREKGEDYVEHAECALYWRIQNFKKAVYNGTLWQENAKFLPDLPVEHEGSSIKWNVSSSVFEVMNNATQGLSTSMSLWFNRTILRNPHSGKLTYSGESKVPVNSSTPAQQRGSRVATFQLATLTTLSIMPRISQKPHHSPHKHTKIIYQFLSSVSAKAIAAKFDLTPRAVYSITQRYKHQKSAKSNPHSGRLPLLNKRAKSYSDWIRINFSQRRRPLDF